MPSFRQFRRDARVTLASPRGGVIAVNPIIVPPSPGVTAIPQLRVAFKVSKSLTAEPNTATIQVSNLSKLSRDRAAEAVRDTDGWVVPAALVDQRLAAFGPPATAAIATGHAYLSLEAGYSGALGTLFEGNATRAVSRHTGTDWETTIDATDGGLGIEKGVANKSFAAGTGGADLVAYLAKTMGLQSGGSMPGGLPGPLVPPALVAWRAKRGYTASGKASELLSMVCGGLNLEWFVEDGELWIVKAAVPGLLIPPGVLPGPPVVVSPIASPASIQLLRRPLRTESDGVMVECLLAPSIRVGRAVTVVSSDLAGSYRCEAVEHVGDNRGGGYLTTAHLRSLSPV